ncbi:MAG: glycoside hydrolase family 95 protein, partial [bacterium]|nr:glycoside hydrolase family 95 protein [bacterium]
NVDAASAKEYEILEREHIKEHRSFFSRQKIELGTDRNSDLPTDERLLKFQQGEIDIDLIALYFQYGRYLLMNSSRKPGRLPANLQGIWNEHLQAPWNSDYHTNINLQMNYWPAEVCNLPETVDLLTDFVDIHRIPGRVTAREMYGADGWTMHHNTDIFGATAVRAGIHWGMSPLAGIWMTFPLWRHYEYTGDAEYLKNKLYPIMKEASEFVLDFLVEDKDGYLVSTPSMSPENSYQDPETGNRVQLTYSPTMDIQILNEHLTRCIEAARILDDDHEYIDRLEIALSKLPPVQIGGDGTIQEWIKDYEEHEPGHRHISHLLGLHPLAQITPETPDLYTAAGKTIEKRLANGGGHTGWSRAWIINFFARLQDGEKACENVNALLQKSTLPNLFDTHPPFQIDGNFGGTAGIAEMLLQSHDDVIRVLPALPEAWPAGKIYGLCARGGFVINIEWMDSKLTNLEIYSKLGYPALIKYNGIEKNLETAKNKTFRLNGNLNIIN